MIQISNLVVEVTRKCNMECGHCLRGDIENIDLKKEYVDTLLSQVDYISNVTFTGGEPSLNIGIVDYFLEQCKEREIGIGGFYIATNGLNIKEDFVMCCLRLFSYCDEKEMCIVHVSNDYYHQNEGSYTTDLLDGLSFFGRKFETEGYDYNRDSGIIRQGRGNDMGHRDLSYEDIEDMDDFNDHEIYLNCKGDIVNGCDLSYKNQDDYIICKVKDLETFVESLDE